MFRPKNPPPAPAAPEPSKQPPPKVSKPPQEGRIKAFFRRNFFDEANLGLNSAKEIAQTWDTNISKITRFLGYALGFVGLVGGGFLYYRYRLLRLERGFTLERVKSALKAKYLLKEAFLTDVHIQTKKIGLFQNGVCDIRECEDYRKVWSDHFKQFQQRQDEPLVLVGPSGFGKTELLETVFLELRKRNRMVAYSNLEHCLTGSQTLGDIVLYGRDTPIVALRTLMEELSEEKSKPLLLLDNVHLLEQMENKNQILKEIEQLRWSRTCNFLMAGSDFDPGKLIMSWTKLRFQGASQPKFYSQLVRKLRFSSDIEEKVLKMKLNLYMLQELYLVENKQQFLASIQP